VSTGAVMAVSAGAIVVLVLAVLVWLLARLGEPWKW
jgi:hypothetical protein